MPRCFCAGRRWWPRATARARSPSRSRPTTSPRIGPTNSSPAPFRDRRKRRLRNVGGALGGIAVATSRTQRQRCAAHIRKISRLILLGVIRLDADRHQILPDPLELICWPCSRRFSERVPQLLETHEQLLRANVLLPRLTRDSFEERIQLRRGPIRLSQLFGKCRFQLLQRAL